MIPDLVIGITGPNASGKGEVSLILQEMGFAYLSLSDVVREVAGQRGEEPVRDVLIRTGRELRREGGPGVLAERILPKIEAPCIVDSVRNPGEVAVLRGLETFFLLGVTAPPALRFRRLQERARPGDPDTLEEFEEKERIEDSPDAEGQRLSATLALADRIIVNDASLEELAGKVLGVLTELDEAVRDRAGDPADEEEQE
jgi:dephospho-CoA kinase